MKKEKILLSKGITPATKHHNYDYLYKSILEAMEEYRKDDFKGKDDE